MTDKMHIGLVTPFSWSTPSAVNQHVADLSRELKARGHFPVIVTSTDAPLEAARIRPLFQRARGQITHLLADYCRGVPADPLLLPAELGGLIRAEEGIPVIPVGSSFPVRLNGGVANLGLPVDVTSRLEKLMVGADFDVLHVHEPLAPSLSFTVLREARSPVIATFHLTPVGIAAFEMGQSLLERFFDRLDARVVVFSQGCDIMNDVFPGEYEVISCGTRIGADGAQAQSRQPIRSLGGKRLGLYIYRGDGRRSYRALLRALLAQDPLCLDGMIVALHQPSVERWVPRGVPRRLRDRVSLCEFTDPAELRPLYEQAAVTVMPYLGGEWLCTTAEEATACGCPLVGPDLPPAHDWTTHFFSPSESTSLGRAIEAAVGPGVGARVARETTGGEAPPDGDAATAVDRSANSMNAVAIRLERLYRDTINTTRGPDSEIAKTPVAGHSLHLRGVGEEPTRGHLRPHPPSARADWINADLHIHSCYSKDCVTPVEAILETAREIGLGAIAIADHNEIQGAILARELAQGDPFVIVAEEIKSAEGEVIGLFIQEAIPKGLSFDETLSRIKEQGGLVYVPHPFDALRTTPSYRALVDNLHRIDVIEIYNAKVALSSFNLSAERFAAKYNLVAGAGSDSHVLQALGTAMLRMPRFFDQRSFMAALWEADIIAKRKSLLYLQSLKLFRTTLDRVLPED